VNQHPLNRNNNTAVGGGGKSRSKRTQNVNLKSLWIDQVLLHIDMIRKI
jgi:hypothetical protein